MARQFSLAYDSPPVMLLPPAADAAGRISAFRNIKWGDKAYVICHVNQGNAAPVSLTVLQATNVAGAGSTSVKAMPIWLNDATASSDALVPQIPAASFTTDATIADKLVIFEILPEAALNVSNGYLAVAIQTGASNAANITEAKLFVMNLQKGNPPETTYV